MVNVSCCLFHAGVSEMFRLKIEMQNNIFLETLFVMCLLLSLPTTGYAKQQWEEIDMA